MSTIPVDAGSDPFCERARDLCRDLCVQLGYAASQAEFVHIMDAIVLLVDDAYEAGVTAGKKEGQHELAA